MRPGSRRAAEERYELNEHRSKIEDAASEKFDSEGLDPENGTYEGRPVLMVRSDDLA
jgi:hypothetical protein